MREEERRAERADQQLLARTKMTQNKISHLRERGFYCHDLTQVKAAAFDSIASEDAANFLDMAIRRHKQKVMLDLLVLAVVRSRLTSEFGSVEEARLKVALQHQHQAAHPANVNPGTIWRKILSTASEDAPLIRSLVMPFLEEERSADH